MARIVLVDDNEANRVLGTKLLRARGHLVTEAATGQTCLSLVLEQAPDLVLIDLGLPDIDGWDLLQRLRADERTRALRAVALTAHAMVGDRERALAAGFDGYVSKPIDASTFADTVASYLSAADEQK